MKLRNLRRILYTLSAVFMLQTMSAQSTLELDSAKYAIEKLEQERAFNREQGEKNEEEAKKKADAEAQKRLDQEKYKTALDYVLMNRYRNPNAQVFSSSLFSHISAGMYTSQPLAFVAPNRNVYSSSYNFHWGAFAQKSLNAYHAIRLQYDFAQMALTDESVSARHQLGMDYLWDLSNYFYGYNESRPWSLSYVAGLDFGLNGESALLSKFYGGIHTGLQVRANLSPRTYFYIEPRISAYSNNNPNDWHKVNVDGSVLVGLGARITSPYESLQWKYNTPDSLSSWKDNYFLQMSLGAYDGISDIANGMSQWGPNFNLAVGRWINPKLALRTSLYSEQLNSQNDSKRLGVMAEGVLNIPQLFNFSMGRFGAEVSTGIRYDIVAPSNSHWGGTSALQLKYFVNQQFALFAEGRYSSIHNKEANGYEDFANVNLGLELYRANFNRYTARNMGMGDVSFNSNYFVSASYGQMFPYQLQGSGDLLSALSNTYGVALGYNFNDYNALRLKVDMTDFKSAGAGARQWTTFSPQYMLYLSNLWMGNNTHRFSLRPYAGPVMSLTEADYFGFGLEVGMPVAWRLNPHFELFVEPTYRYMAGEALRANEAYKGLLSMSGGISYVHGYIPFKEYFQDFDWGKDWFIAYYGGLQQDMSTIEHDNITALPVGNIALGRWFGPLGLRLSGSASLNRALCTLRQKPFLVAMAYAGARAEGMINLTTFVNPKSTSPFEVNLLAGYQGSYLYRPLREFVNDWSYVGGLTSAFQLKYYVYDGLGFFIEPRYTWLNYQRTPKSEYADITSDFSQRLTEVNIGMEVRQKNITRHDLRRSYIDFDDRGFLSASLGAALPLHYNGSNPGAILNNFSSQLSVMYGYDFNAINTLRGGLTYHGLLSQYTTEKNSGIAVNVDYMPNLTNGMLGYDPARALDFKAIVGLNALYSSYEDKVNLGLHGGAQVSLQASNQLNLFAEGKVAAYHKPSIIEGMYTVKNVGLMPIASLGATYYFSPSSASIPSLFEAGDSTHWIIDFYTGPQFDTSIFGTNINPKMGFDGGISIGRMSGALGWRAGGFLSLNRTWKGDHAQMMAYGGMRIEGMADLFNIISPQDATRPFTINALVGYQPGIVYRPYNPMRFTRNWAWTHGPTGALQLVWQTGPVGFFAEPRYTWLNYTREYRKGINNIARFNHRHFEFNVGMRLRQTQPNFNISSADFEQGSSISLDGGTIYPLHYKSKAGINGILSHLGCQFGIGLSRQFTELSAFRIKFDYQNLKSQYADDTYMGIRFGLDYMGNISNLLWGYKKDRMIDIQGFAGINLLQTDYMNKTNFGIGGGFNARVEVFDNVNLHIEPRCDFYSNRPKIIPGLRTIHYVGIVPSLSAGVTYEF